MWLARACRGGQADLVVDKLTCCLEEAGVAARLRHAGGWGSYQVRQLRLWLLELRLLLWLRLQMWLQSRLQCKCGHWRQVGWPQQLGPLQTGPTRCRLPRPLHPTGGRCCQQCTWKSGHAQQEG